MDPITGSRQRKATVVEKIKTVGKSKNVNYEDYQVEMNQISNTRYKSNLISGFLNVVMQDVWNPFK